MANKTDTKGSHRYARVVPVSVFRTGIMTRLIRMDATRTIFSQGTKSILAWFAIGRVGVGGVYIGAGMGEGIEFSEGGDVVRGLSFRVLAEEGRLAMCEA